MLSLHWQRKRQPIIIGLLLHLRPQMNSFQNSWLLQEFFFFFLLSILPHPRRHFVASYSIPLCSLWLSIWCWPILKESQLGFLFCYKSSSSHVCLHRGNPSEELDMCLNKQARKNKTRQGHQIFVVFGEWVISLMPHKEKTSEVFSQGRISFLDNFKANQPAWLTWLY